MRRRTFLGAALGGLTACGGRTDAATGAPAVVTGERIKWRLASSFPRSLDTIFGAAEVLAERVSAMTGGAFQIRVYPAGEIVPALQVMDAVQQGTVHIGQTASYYYIGKNPALAFDTCVPFGLSARQQAAWLLEGGGLQLVNQRFADFGIVSFPGGNTGVQMGGWFNRPVRSLADLKGLKMRIPGMGGAVMERLGVATQTLAGGEIYTALERGAIDATDWVGPYDDEKLGFHKVVKNYHYPGWWEPGPSLSFYVNQAQHEALPAAYKEILRAATAEAGIAMQTRYDAKNPPALRRIRGAGVQVQPFSDDLLQGAREASRALLEEEAAQDPAYREIYTAWEAFRRDSFSWFSTAERSYAQFAFR
ncbi:MAG TPA: ABC transporter substrate-binding protein [Deltaproteobacteria bacterium]|nr:ABC transporter substrate-binding protein [Deltaproteobacteria bacterium]